MDAINSFFLPLESLATVVLAAATYNLARQNTIYRRKDILNSRLDEVKHAASASEAWTFEAIEQSEENRRLLKKLIEIKEHNRSLSPSISREEKDEAIDNENKALAEYNYSVDSNSKLKDKYFEVLTQLSGIDPLIASIKDDELISLLNGFNRLYEVSSAKIKTSNEIDLTNISQLDRLKINLQEIDMTLEYYKDRKKLLIQMVSRSDILKK